MMIFLPEQVEGEGGWGKRDFGIRLCHRHWMPHNKTLELYYSSIHFYYIVVTLLHIYIYSILFIYLYILQSVVGCWPPLLSRNTGVRVKSHLQKDGASIIFESSNLPRTPQSTTSSDNDNKNFTISSLQLMRQLPSLF